MEASQEQMLSILELILPKEILEYFTVTNLTIQAKEVHLFLDERNEIPDELKGEKLISKGFHPESVVQDFPFRNKALLLHVRWRKWEVESSKKIVSRTWNLSAEETRYSNEFAAFFKGLLGYLPDKF
jgi:hypothetical protein